MNTDAESGPGGARQAGPYDASSAKYPRAGETPADPYEAAEAPADNPATNAARAVSAHLRELIGYASYWLAAKIDSIKLSVRNAAVYAALGVIGLLGAVALIVTAVVLLLLGFARLLDRLTNTSWAGDLIVSVVVLGGLAGGIYIGLNKFLGTSRKKTELKYEAKRIQQRAEHGRDVCDQAQEH